MAGRRIIAALVAIALVVIALLIRNGIDSGSGSGSTSGSGRPRLVCTPELESVCKRLGSDVDLTIEDPGRTADRLEKADGDLGIDGWLAPEPWAEMVIEARARNQTVPGLTVGNALARSSIGMAVWPDRLAVMKRICGGDPTWRCIGDVANKGDWRSAGGPAEWGPVRIAIPDPANDATGLAALGAATAGYFGRDASTLSSVDLDDLGFRAWLRGLAKAEADRAQLSEILAIGRSAAAAAATFEAVGTQLIRTAADKPALTYPAPVASANVVMGIADTDNGKQLRDLIRPEQLIAASWEAPKNTPTGLPSPGFLDALRDAWKSAA